MWIFPTWYTDKWSADSTDKVWASDAVTNFNLTVDEIWTENFSNRTTTDLAEWVNEYYTEARVDANSTVVWLWTTKADKSNVLELDNTTPFTPTLTYHPVTKDYVDTLAVPIVATDAEAEAWTNEIVYINPKQLNNWNWYSIVSSDVLLAIYDTQFNIPSWTLTYTKFKDYKVDIWGTYKVEHNLVNSATWNVYSRIYVNDVAVWTERIEASWVATTYSEDITVNAWDNIQLYIYLTATAACTVYSFTLFGSIRPNSLLITAVL